MEPTFEKEGEGKARSARSCSHAVLAFHAPSPFEQPPCRLILAHNMSVRG